MNKLSFVSSAFALFAGAFFAFSQTGKPAYLLYDNEGREITYTELISSVSKYDVVFLGEMHNCPVTHWLEYEIVKSLFEVHGDSFVLGAEMFEADNQLLVDEYMGGLVSSDRFEEEAKLWPNYSTDYYPFVFFAKDNGIPFVATNVPRRYANSVKNGGFEALEKFSEEALRYIAPLPIAFEYDEAESEAAFGMMTSLGGRLAGDTANLSKAQALKDATMAWFISQNCPKGKHLLHINGSYHSDSHAGIIPYLKGYSPKVSVVTIIALRQESVDALDEENKGRADYYICIPEDMVNSY